MRNEMVQLLDRKIWVWVLSFTLVVCAVIIAIGSLMPVPAPKVVPGTDKLVHFLAYGSLAIVAGLQFLFRSDQLNAFWVWIGCSSYGALMEVLQGMTAHRTMEFADGCFNSLGAMFGLVALSILSHFFWPRLQSQLESAQA